MKALCRCVFANSPRLHGVNRPTALEAAEPRAKLRDGKAQRDARKIADRSQSDRAASLTVALDVRIASAANSSMVACRGFMPAAYGATRLNVTNPRAASAGTFCWLISFLVKVRTQHTGEKPCALYLLRLSPRF